MKVRVEQAGPEKLAELRELYRQEMDCQIVHDSWHERGFLRSYLISVDERVVGYGSVGGVGDEPPDLVKEFFLHERDRHVSRALFQELVAAAGARRIESQTNDGLLTQMLMDTVEAIERDRILFEDAAATDHAVAGAVFRPIRPDERDTVFAHEVEPVGDWVIALDGQVVATGGLTFYYNPPYSDLYMEVAAPMRRGGLGALIVQELKRVSYEMERKPAARCDASNAASRRTLERAGMAPCAWIIRGTMGAVPC